MAEIVKPEIAELQKASQGLLYPSESDIPFDAFLWESNAAGHSSARDAVAAHVQPGRSVESVPLEKFFADLSQSWEPTQAESFRHALQSVLSGLGVFRVGTGDVEVDLFLVGKTRSGEWAGLHTQSIET